MLIKYREIADRKKLSNKKIDQILLFSHVFNPYEKGDLKDFSRCDLTISADFQINPES